MDWSQTSHIMRFVYIHTNIYLKIHFDIESNGLFYYMFTLFDKYPKYFHFYNSQNIIPGQFTEV